ncbi:MAG: hypothetical protein VKS61_04785 [Candidatus Sericytochromatia bacterium]|nr:hypothetical protein [Candidatus Sericytochromatia bacterium]MEB3221373.1 hypothetical protein [Candidatus Sericytochromatia bacterium]
MTDDDHAWKQLLDPHSQFPAEALTGLEQRAREALMACGEVALARTGEAAVDGRRPFDPAFWTRLPRWRTRDVFQADVPVGLDWGGEELAFLSLVVTEEALEVRLPAIAWTTGYGGPALVASLWRREPFAKLRGSALRTLLAEGFEALRARHVVCSRCGEGFGPGRCLTVGDEVVCHGCAEGELGVVF